MEQRAPHLDAALLPRSGVKVAFPNPLRDLGPQRTALPLALFLDRPHGDLLLRTRHIRECRAGLGVLARRVPLPLIAARLRARAGADGRGEVRLERVRLARKVALALVLDRGQPAGRALDGRRLRELDVGRAVPEPLDAQARERDQVVLFLSVGERDGQRGVPDLLHDDVPA